MKRNLPPRRLEKRENQAAGDAEESDARRNQYRNWSGKHAPGDTEEGHFGVLGARKCK